MEASQECVSLMKEAMRVLGGEGGYNRAWKKGESACPVKGGGVIEDAVVVYGDCGC